MVNSKPFQDFREAVYDRSSPYNGDFSDSPSSQDEGPRFFTIFEKGRKIKLYPDEKMIEVLNENSQVFFDADSRRLAKYDAQTGDKLLITASESFFYLRIFLEYIRGIHSWTPGVEF